jgi:trimeric autotransporter adhesin
MRRFVTLVVLFLFAIPFGVSISGCSKNLAPVFCNGGDSGPTTGQATTITLNPIVYGISLNFAEIGQVSSPASTDCKGNSASIGLYTYATTDKTIADVEPTNGQLCGGTWNRNSGGGIPDYTFCIPTNKAGTAYITASADGVTSNPIPVFIHPIVTSIVLGGASATCTGTDLSTACCPFTTPGSVTAPPYQANSCISQGGTAQLIARIFSGTGANQTNISCQVGHLQFTSQSASSLTSVSPVVNIDQNGVATANQPGSILISANIANASSSAGFFSTCPPASITLSATGTTANPVVVNQNNNQPLSATAVDTKGAILTGLSLEYVSTSPTTIPAGATVTPILAGSASITALCQPPSCNSASYNQIGLFGNGKPVTSNSVDVVAPGTNSTVLYMASTQSQYMVARDFTQPGLGTPFLLPYVPNSMVLSLDGSSIYMGSSTALMVVSAVNSLNMSRTDITSPGVVLAVSPDGSQIVISDPVKQIISLENTSGGVVTTYGASCPAPGASTPSNPPCRAQYAPDSQTLYVTAGNQLLVYSAFTGWTSISPATSGGTPLADVAITVPSVGAYFAGPATTARSYCPISTPATAPNSESNIFYPPADSSPAITDRIAATNDGLHILGATVSPVPTLSDLRVQIPAGNNSGFVSIKCPDTGTLSFSNTLSTTLLSPVTATAITGVLPTSDSKYVFVTYTGSGGVLPAYSPIANGPGSTTYVPLGTATGQPKPVAPVAGVVSADNTKIFTGTSGDNLVHVININGNTLTDDLTQTLTPSLTGPGGAIVPVNLLAQKPRKTT